MKFIKPRSPATRRLLGSSHAIAVASLLTLPALAEFSGNDKLESKSSNWERAFEDVGGARFVFRNSRLEYQVKSPAHKNTSALRWTPNEGDYDEDWFIQVDVNINNFTMPKGSDTDLNLGVVNTRNPQNEHMIGFDQSRIEGIIGGYKSTKSIQTSPIFWGWPIAPSIDGTSVRLRLHFDSKAKTLTGSWKTGAYWRYFDPVSISTWGMNDGDTFTAILTAFSNGFAAGTLGPVVPPGTAWFRNFKAGPARPEIAVDQPAGSSLKDGKSKRSFGTVAVGNRATRTFPLYNMGTAPLKNLKITKSGPNAADFTIAEPSSTSLNPGAITAFDVTFRPKGNGTRTATLHMASNDPDGPTFDIKLAGEGAR